MSFRSRLTLFFTIIVIIPMIAVALVLFTLTAESETGKADARIAQGMRVAFSLYEQAAADARPELRRVAADQGLNAALLGGRAAAARQRMSQIVRFRPSIEAIAFYDRSGDLVARGGSRRAVAPASVARTVPGRGRLGTLSVSVTTAREYVRQVERLTGLEAAVLRSGRRLASTVSAELPRRAGSGDVEIGGSDYRLRVDRVREVAGPPVAMAVFQESQQLTSSISDSRLLIGGILLAFLLLALSSSIFVVRALQGQIGQFLEAARRLGRGNFDQRVPIEGRDEFAALGREFNSMSEQLAGKIAEVQRKRQELEETIRRVGEAFAAGLDRQGVVELAVQTAVEASEAEAGRALPIDGRTLETTHTGSEDPDVVAALEAAEREAFKVRPEVGSDLLAPGQSDGEPPEERRAVAAQIDGVHALAYPMRARLGSRSYAQYVGVVSIARRRGAFTDADRELLEYLAGQAAVSIENSDLHETVQRQAITDELTGLSNVRQFHVVLDRELERSDRFDTPVGLVMLDIDDFKSVNDTYGHQQGDEVLAHVAQALRELSRDIDEPARYGGEELAVITPQTDSAGAALAAERMRAAVEELRIPRVDGEGTLSVTASLGVAAIPDSAWDKASLIAAADAALYQAKRSGKNQVMRADPAPARR